MGAHQPKAVITEGRVLITTNIGYMWGTNFYEAAEFQTKKQMQKLVPKDLLAEFEWDWVEYPDDKVEQQIIARQYKIGYSNDVVEKDLKLPDVYTPRLYKMEETAAIIGMVEKSLKVYYRYLGELKKEESPNKRGKKRPLFSVEQVNTIFRLRLHNPNLNSRVISERYEEWLSSLT